MVLAGSSSHSALEITLHGRRPDALASPQATAVDALQVLLKDNLLEAVTGSPESLNPGNLLPEGAAAIEAPALSNLQIQHAMAKAPVVVPDRPPAPALVSQTGAAAVRARYRLGLPPFLIKSRSVAAILSLCPFLVPPVAERARSSAARTVSIRGWT